MLCKHVGEMIEREREREYNWPMIYHEANLVWRNVTHSRHDHVRYSTYYIKELLVARTWNA